MSWLQNIRQWTGLHKIQTIIHTAKERVEMENLVAITSIINGFQIKKKISSSKKVLSKLQK